MSMMKVGVLGIVGVLFAIQLKQEKPAFALYLSIGISTLIFLGIMDHIEILVETIKEIGSLIQLENTYMGMLLKMLGITYIAEFSSGICKDAGYQTIASQIEVFSKLTILVLGLPIVLALIQTIREFMA